MEKTKDAAKRQLKEQWEKACNGFLVELLRMWELDRYYGSWVAEEVGGVFDYKEVNPCGAMLRYTSVY